MKKTIIIAILILSVFSCTKNEQDSFFENTPTERMAQNRNEFFKSLNETNWVIEIFPAADQRYGGYSVFADFEEDYKVTLWNELGLNAEKKTSYDIISRDGSVLTFNTYNNGIHFFSNPSFSNPKGYEGDYEFIYLKKEDKTIFTKGVKTKNDTRFLATNLTHEEYFQKISEVQEAIKEKIYSVSKPKESAGKIEIKGRVLVYTDENKEEEEVAFVYRPNGIRLYKPIKINKLEVSEFTFNETKDLLSSTDGKVEVKVDTPMIYFSLDSRHAILFRNGAVSPSLLEKYEEAKLKSKQGYDEDLLSFMVIEKYSGELVFFMASGRYPVRHIIKPEYHKKDEVSFVLTGVSSNWRWYPWVHPLMKEFGLKSPFKIEVSETIGDFKLTSMADSNVWFYLVKL